MKKIGVDIPSNNLKNVKGFMCQIMDEADRNTYTCTDLADFFNLNKNKPTEADLKEAIIQINLKNITKKAKNENRELTIEEIENSKKITVVQNIIIKELASLKDKGVSEVQNYFENKMKIFNKNFRFKNEEELLMDNKFFITYKDDSIQQTRELFSGIAYEMFIEPIRKQDFHLNNMELLKLIANKAYTEQFTESNRYGKKMKAAFESGNEKEYLRAVRDMIGELTDWYVIRMGNELTEGLDKTINLINFETKSKKPRI